MRILAGNELWDIVGQPFFYLVGEPLSVVCFFPAMAHDSVLCRVQMEQAILISWT